MTTRDSDIDGHVPGDRDTDAKLVVQRRQQLSALVDGELAPDQARFLERRLGHDDELVGRWERWHLIGDVLRGQAVVAMPGGADGFAARVAAAVAADHKSPAARPRWQHGLGVALAASVAAVALFFARPVSVDGELQEIVAGGGAAIARAPAPPPPSVSTEPVRAVSVPQFADDLPAVARGPRTRGDAPSQAPSQAIASTSSDPPASATQVAADAPVADAPTPDAPTPATVLAAMEEDRPFASPRQPQARPWPRAVLPGLVADTGEVTVGLEGAVEPPSFYPFEPQLPVEPERTP